MKKSTFIVTETILSVILAAALGTVAVLTVDIKTNGSILPQEWFANKTAQQSSPQSTDEESVPALIEDSASEIEESSVPEKENSTSPAEVLNLHLEEPENLSAQPTELTTYLNDFGYDYDSFTTDRCILVATTSINTANIYCYQKGENGYWWNIAGEGKAITDKGFIGENGADFDVAPGEKKSPLGIYSMGRGFYVGDKPQTEYPLFAITDNTYWIDDPESEYYNQLVEGTENKDWESAIHMIDHKEEYSCGIVIRFNTSDPADKELASGIFMCCGDAPTDGSVVVPENVMKAILEWMDEDSNPYIFVTPLIG